MNERSMTPETGEIKKLHEEIIGDEKKYITYLNSELQEIKGDLNLIKLQLQVQQSPDVEKKLLNSQEKLNNVKDEIENTLSMAVFVKNEQELLLDKINKEIEEFNQNFPEINKN